VLIAGQVATCSSQGRWRRAHRRAVVACSSDLPQQPQLVRHLQQLEVRRPAALGLLGLGRISSFLRVMEV
jgi:hypothetical protein